MTDGLQAIFDENGVADVYDDTYDIVIHCKTEGERNEAVKHLKNSCWSPVGEKLPDADELVLLSFENANFVMIGRYTVDDEGSGTFRIGDDDESFTENDMYVNAWMRLPGPYREGTQ